MSSLPNTLRRWYCDGTRADEQPGADLRVGESVARKPRDLELLRGQLARGVDVALAGGLAGGVELARGPVGERLGAHPGEELVRGAQLRAAVEPAAAPPQPLAVEQVRASEVRARACAGQALDRLAMGRLGLLALQQQRARAGLDPEAPVGAAGRGRRMQPLERGRRALGVAGTNRGLDELDERQGVRPGRMVLRCAPRGRQRRLVAAEPVVEDRRGVFGES